MKIHLPVGFPVKTITLGVNVPALEERDIREIYPRPSDSQQIGLAIKGHFYWFIADPAWSTLMQKPKIPYEKAFYEAELIPAILVLEVKSGNFELVLNPAHYSFSQTGGC